MQKLFKEFKAEKLGIISCVLDCWEGEALRKMGKNITRGLLVNISPALAPLSPTSSLPVFQITSRHTNKTQLP